MKHKVLNLLLILTSLIGYLEWGGGNAMFLVEGEIDVLRKLFTDPISVAHPFTVLPMLGQLLLLITLFQREPSRLLTLAGLAFLSVLLMFMFLIGAISMNLRIFASTVPFVIVAILVILEVRNRK